ncbi:SRPBCC domain-containing protein [Natrinema sp. SYSU A 869]|uniref:SRPBCC family protein n=1 Tax=Natrinema sp. SYSU A 869 TaxID=2871694 RepID=UPI001CA3F449|nr:SRPBCC domain-containing protein [Natrinema sp. SYSU A 869]
MTPDTTDETEIETTDASLTIRRTFDAPRERVWRAFTDPDELSQWWGPANWTLSVSEMDFREGGVWHFCMQGPDSEESWGKVVYEELVEPERIVATDLFADEEGDRVADTPKLSFTFEFADRDGATELTLTHEGFPTAEMIEGAEIGWTGSFDELETHLEGLMTDSETVGGDAFDPSEYDVTITRTFEAPREAVWDAWTDPEQVAEWWGPTDFTVPRCEMDVRPGGAFRIDMEAPDGTVYPSDGRFEAVDEPERLVLVDGAVEDDDGNYQFEVRQTVTFVDLNGTTELTLEAAVLEATPEVAKYLEGMEEGWNQSFEKLDDFVALSGGDL